MTTVRTLLPPLAALPLLAPVALSQAKPATHPAPNADFSKAAVKLLIVTKNTRNQEPINAAVAQAEAAANTPVENDEFVPLKSFAYLYRMAVTEDGIHPAPPDSAPTPELREKALYYSKCMAAWLTELRKRSSRIPACDLARTERTFHINALFKPCIAPNSLAIDSGQVVS